jgi:hypothetical protein
MSALTPRNSVLMSATARDVGVPDYVDEPERALRGRHLDDGLYVDVAVADQLAAPVPIGVHLRMRGDGPGNRGDDERGERQRRIVIGELAPGLGDVDLE